MIGSIRNEQELANFIRRTLSGTPVPLHVKFPKYLAAAIPPAADHEGEAIYVPDGGAGAQFRASNGSSWVNLG